MNNYWKIQAEKCLEKAYYDRDNDVYVHVDKLNPTDKRFDGAIQNAIKFHDECMEKHKLENGLV